MPTNKKPEGAGGRSPSLTQATASHHMDCTFAAQRARMLAALKAHSLTTLQARRELDVLHPAARVMELRRDGYLIERTWAHDLTSEGHRHRVARYHLTGERAQYELF